MIINDDNSPVLMSLFVIIVTKRIDMVIAVTVQGCENVTLQSCSGGVVGVI